MSMVTIWDRRQLQRRFEERLMPHVERLYQFARRLTKNEQDAEDLVQDTLFKAYRALDRLPRDANYRGWLFTILRNKWLSNVRREGRVYYQNQPPDTPCSRENALTVLLNSATDERDDRFDDLVSRALDCLSEPQRTAVLLCDVEQLPYQEIAQILECPIGTVRSRIFHARRQLRLVLKVYAVSEGVLRS